MRWFALAAGLLVGVTQPRQAIGEGAIPVEVSTRSISDANNSPRVIPTPKERTPSNANAVFDAFPVPRHGEGLSRELWQAAYDDLARYWKTLTANQGPDVRTDTGLIFQFAPNAEPIPEAGYQLRVDNHGITVSARDAAGFRHAVQTIKQLSWVDASGRIVVGGGTIRDWPALAFRGVHLFTGGRGPELHQRLIRDVLAPLKFNHLVLEAEYVEWDAYPEIHHPRYGMPKSEVRRILDVCKENGIEVIPLVQTLGHCEWMFTGDHHLDLAEDPEARWAYCATNPDTYKFIFRVYEEMLELFNPRIVHIGHDEFNDKGRVPFRPESKQYSVEELFTMDTLKLHAWLKDRGVRTMMWGDMLLGPGEAPDATHAKSRASAKLLRDQLPNDIIIADWHYATVAPERYTSLQTLQDAGHPTLAATWFEPTNIVSHARAAHRAKSLGLLQTTWAGFSLDEETLATEVHQYVAHVIAAEAAWNADRDIKLDVVEARRFLFDRLGMTERAGE